MEALVEKSADLYLRKVDVVRWDSAVAGQHSIRRLPHLILYDAKGNVLAEGTREVLEEIQ